MNKLLELFEVDSFDELVDYCKEHPEEEKVKELKELVERFGCDLDELD